MLDEGMTHKEKASALNVCVTTHYSEEIERVIAMTPSRTERLEAILTIMYSGYVVMLEYRNKVWPYEYMAFSRRIGEIWEPFCKLPFIYPTTVIEQFQPPTFSEIESSMRQEIRDYIESLDINGHQKEHLVSLYQKVWGMVDSGSVSLKLDLHIIHQLTRYNIDYKSGFSSNEKGNTNRLLLVGSIYSALSDNYKNLIFVRQEEDENNHYLKTLSNSPFWEVYCAGQAYQKIEELSGFNLKAWMESNINWQQDFENDFSRYLIDQELIRYLTW